MWTRREGRVSRESRKARLEVREAMEGKGGLIAAGWVVEQYHSPKQATPLAPSLVCPQVSILCWDWEPL